MSYQKAICDCQHHQQGKFIIWPLVGELIIHPVLRSQMQVFTKKNRDVNRQGRSAQTAFLLHIVSSFAKAGLQLCFWGLWRIYLKQKAA
ncbi:hypothetical protein VTN96DRAFT_6656 [Rasamsonia emersonii]